MAQEYFMRVPTYLGLYGTPEIQAQPLGANTQSDKIVEFVLKYYSVAVKVGKAFGLHPLVILAQGSIESGWGTSQLARENNNFFGVTAFGKPNQYWKGDKRVSTKSGLSFRSYQTVEAGFSDFARIITSYYKEAAKVSNDVKAYAEKIAYSPYISEKNGDNRIKYRALIIQSAETILAIAKKKYQETFN
jgi:flagellar protein FlgJ